MGKMTPQQELFGIEFCKDFNGTKAAIRAKYAKAGAAVQASRLLRKANVQAYIRAHLQKVESEAVVTKARVLQEYARMALIDPRKFFDEDGNLIHIQDLDEDTARALEGFDFTTEFETGGGKKKAVGTTAKIKFGKRGALQDVGKHLGMFGPNSLDDDEVQRFFAGFTIIAPGGKGRKK